MAAFPQRSDSMKPVAFIGPSGAGKTTLIERIIVLASSLGYEVTVIKHTHHSPPFHPGAGDTARFIRAGAVEAILVSPEVTMFASTGMTTGLSEPDSLLDAIPPAHLVLVEGFSSWQRPARIAVAPSDITEVDDCVAVVSDAPVHDHPTTVDAPRFRFAELAGLFQFVVTIAR